MYRVIKRFMDLQDGAHHYEVGDPFPRSGKTVTEARLKELASARNRQGIPLIEEIAEEPEPEAIPEEAIREEEAPAEAPEEPKKKGKKK